MSPSAHLARRPLQTVVNHTSARPDDSVANAHGPRKIAEYASTVVAECSCAVVTNIVADIAATTPKAVMTLSFGTRRRPSNTKTSPAHRHTPAPAP